MALLVTIIFRLFTFISIYLKSTLFYVCLLLDFKLWTVLNDADFYLFIIVKSYTIVHIA